MRTRYHQCMAHAKGTGQGGGGTDCGEEAMDNCQGGRFAEGENTPRRGQECPCAARPDDGGARSHHVQVDQGEIGRAREEVTASSNKPSIPVRPNEYNLSDEESLSSPFLRRVERERTVLPTFGTRNLFQQCGGEEATTSSNKHSIPVPPNEYDLSDEENLPSPFLRRVERERTALPTFGTMNSFLQCGGTGYHIFEKTFYPSPTRRVRPLRPGE